MYMKHFYKNISSMNQKKLLIALCLLAFGNTLKADIEFINGDLKLAKERAAREGKLIFLDFWASYCTPCRMMEEYTFTDPSVSAYVNDNYISVKVDIQSFDGYDLKNQYKIALLPTIVVLNSKGVQVGKHEESMSAQQFEATLRLYDSPKNRYISANNALYNNHTGYSNNTTHSLNDDSKPIYDTKPIYDVKPESKRKPVATTPTGMLKVSTSEAVSTGNFTIQAGAFSNMESIKPAAQILKRQVGSSQRVFISKKEENGRLMYRVLVGGFKTRQEANNFMHQKGIKGLVKDMNLFK
jgi:thiol-disulfide isomerase/thioredoxin